MPGQQNKLKHSAFASCLCWQMSDDVKGKRDKGHLTSTTPRYKTTLTTQMFQSHLLHVPGNQGQIQLEPWVNTLWLGLHPALAMKN